MNLFDSSFLCLDIGAAGVRGCAHRVRNARIDKSAVFSMDSRDTVYALKSVIDELERQIGAHFDAAYVTGDFGDAHFDMSAKSSAWGAEHKITASDVRAQIAQITPPDGFYPMHIVPLRYDTPGARNVLTPIGHTDRALISAFGAIFYDRARMDEITAAMRRAHIQTAGFFDPHFLLNATLRRAHENTMFIDLGDAYTTASIWTDRGPVMFRKIPGGGAKITGDIADKMRIDPDAAERVKRAVASLAPQEMDRFTPADPAYDFSRADINEIILPRMVEIAGAVKEAAAAAITKYRPTKIMLGGGGAEMAGAAEFFENVFSIPVQKLPYDAPPRALATYIWALQKPRIDASLARQERMRRRSAWLRGIFHIGRPRKRAARFIPIMPSTLCFNMRRPETYTLFKSGGISMIHVDIMDGFYVDRVAGGINELKMIRGKTNAHLHVHLMTESPSVWAADAIAAGADTVVVSTNTSGVRTALREIRAAGRRAGVALNPDSSVSILKPILREVDEVMVMSVAPGAAGQPFDPGALKKISVLNATRKKYNLKFTISVDGGINADTAAQCWAAGADALVSGSYLARSTDFPLAVQRLLPAAKK
ncbi:MAG: ribulose-phosphate 3-epimerase [Alphaproteobacteria bacterium]|nr:ribulose-phosphate 3-epimerase [Alphaproteobacteria bacterium]